MLTELQKRTAQAIVNLFEGSRITGDYSAVSVTPGDKGELSYGKQQATLASGHLAKLIEQYCAMPDARLGIILRGYLDRLRSASKTPEDNDERGAIEMLREALRDDKTLIAVLRATGGDEAMQRCQDVYFDARFWEPAVHRCEMLNINLPLSVAVVYDSYVHGSFNRIMERTAQWFQRNKAHGEQAWISRYVLERDAWLRNHRNLLLRKTVYRTEEFRKLIDAGNWDLTLPITVRDVEITEEALGWTQSS